MSKMIKKQEIKVEDCQNCEHLFACLPFDNFEIKEKINCKFKDILL